MTAPDKNTKGNLTQEELYQEIVEYLVLPIMMCPGQHR